MKIERQRYILVEYISDDALDEKTFQGAFWQVFTRLFGEVNASGVGFYLVYHSPVSRQMVIRCSHVQRDNVISALSLTRKVGGKPVACSTRLTSGTLAGLRRGAENVGSPPEEN